MKTTTVSRIRRESGGYTFTAVAPGDPSGQIRRYATHQSGSGLAIFTGKPQDAASGFGGAGWKQIVGHAQYPFAETNPKPATFRARAVRYFAQDE